MVTMYVHPITWSGALDHEMSEKEPTNAKVHPRKCFNGLHLVAIRLIEHLCITTGIRLHRQAHTALVSGMGLNMSLIHCHLQS